MQAFDEQEAAGFDAQDSSQAASQVQVLVAIVLKASTSASHHAWKEVEFDSSQALVEDMFKASLKVAYGQFVPFDPSMGPVEQAKVADNKSLIEGLGRTKAKPSGEDQFEEPYYTSQLDQTIHG